MRKIGKLQKSLPLFNAVAVDCSFCCCFVSTKTDVGKPLTSTVADNKIEKITPTLYFKSHAILLNTEKKIVYSNRRDLFSFSMNRWREQNIFHFKFVVLFHINGAEIHNKNATFRETCWFSTSTTIKAISHTLCMYRLNQTSWTVSCFFYLSTSSASQICSSFCDSYSTEAMDNFHRIFIWDVPMRFGKSLWTINGNSMNWLRDKSAKWLNRILYICTTYTAHTGKQLIQTMFNSCAIARAHR